MRAGERVNRLVMCVCVCVCVSRSTLHTDSLLSSKEDMMHATSGGGGDMRQWSSTDSSGYSTDGSSRLRLNVTKASSFHGVTVLSRADTGTTGVNTGDY